MKKFSFVFLSLLFLQTSYGQSDLRSICTDSTAQDIRESIAYYNGRLSIDSSDQISYYRLGMCYYKLRDFTTAIQYFDALIALNPKFPEAFSNRGICKLLTSQKDGARKDFESSLKLGQDPSVINGQKLSEWVKENK